MLCYETVALCKMDMDRSRPTRNPAIVIMEDPVTARPARSSVIRFFLHDVRQRLLNPNYYRFKGAHLVLEKTLELQNPLKRKVLQVTLPGIISSARP